MKQHFFLIVLCLCPFIVSGQQIENINIRFLDKEHINILYGQSVMIGGKEKICLLAKVRNIDGGYKIMVIDKQNPRIEKSFFLNACIEAKELGISQFIFRNYDSILLIPKLEHPLISPLFLIDSAGKLKNKYYIDGKHTLATDEPLNNLNTSLANSVWLDNNVYMPQNPWLGPNETSFFDKDRKWITKINLTNSTYKQILTPYPSFFRGKLWIQWVYWAMLPQGKIAYSFTAAHSISVQDTTTKEIIEYPCKSKYIDQIPPMDSWEDVTQKINYVASVSMYNHLLYNPYLKQYYRFARLKKNKSTNKPTINDKGEQTVMVLDENFKLQKEVLLPEFRYLFVGKSGLFLIVPQGGVFKLICYQF